MTTILTRTQMLTAVTWLCVSFQTPWTSAADVKIYDNGEVAVWGRENPSGVVETAVSTYSNSLYQGSFKVLEFSDRVPGTASWPLTVADIIANTFLRLTYQKLDGTTAALGTSVVGYPSYRDSGGLLQYVPSVSRTDISFGGSDRILTELKGSFGADASIASLRTFPDPSIGSTTTRLTLQFTALRDISLDTGLLGSDAFRLVGMSSMYVNCLTNDANVLRWQNASGTAQILRLTETTPRNTHLFSSPKEIDVGGYFELIKEPNASWYPDSPSVRLTLMSLSNLTGRVGVQGWIEDTTNPSHDSLTVWLEWMDAPGTIVSGRTWEASFSVTASPPTPAPDLPWAPSAVYMGNGWWWLAWFGYFADSGAGWIYHQEHGWMYCIGPPPSSIWFWTQDMGWLWSSDTVYPSLYRLSPSAWLWYLREGQAPNRWFLNLATGIWEQH